MSEQCHVCGPVKHEAPTVLCASCAFLDPQSMTWELIRRRLADRCTADSSECAIRRQCTNKCGRLQMLRDCVSVRGEA